MDQKLRTAGLDPRTREYLRGVRAAGKAAGWGLYRERRGAFRSVILGAITAGALLAWGTWKLFDEGLYLDSPPVPTWIYAVFALAALILASTLHSLRAHLSPSYLGRFEFVDATAWWTVDAHTVTAASIAGLESVEGAHRYENNIHKSSEIIISLGSRVVRRSVTDEKWAERVVAFLDIVGELRAMRWPAEVGRLAVSCLGPSGERIDCPVLDIPKPGGKPATLLSDRLMLQLAMVAATVAVSAVSFPPLADFLKDRNLFERAVSAGLEDPDPIDNYIEQMPQGRYLKQVLAHRDDIRFAIAQQRAKEDHSPTRLRDYLAEKQNTRHRGEARALINGFYAEAIRRLLQKDRQR